MKSFLICGIVLFLIVNAFPFTGRGQNIPYGYYSYDDILTIADTLVQEYPAICRKVQLGTSMGGRQLFALRICHNADTTGPEPQILFDAGIHGNEIGGPQNLILYAQDLCQKYNHDSLYTDLINSRQIWLDFMVNPDGRDGMTRYNDAGVDLNRDFGYMWDTGGTSPAPFSQVESRALRNFMLDHNFVIYTDYHSGTEIIAYPWSYRPNPTRDNADLDSIAAVYSRKSEYPNLLYGQGFHDMYQVIGSTKDYQYGVNGGVSWSIEISNNQQPPDSMIQVYYHDNLPSMNEMIKRSGWGIQGSVTDSLNGMPVQATIWINNLYPVSTDHLPGDYHKFVIPGIYSVSVTANGYASKNVSNVIVPDSGSVIVNFQLTQLPSYYAKRIIACQIPGFNFFDEGYTPGCLGAPDNIPYSMGHYGWVIIDMGDTIYDGPGNDFRVWQSGPAIKTINVYAGNSMDGPWVFIGYGMYTCDFDLSSAGLTKTRYLKIVDDGIAPATGSGAGYNLDAVEMLTIPLRANFMAGTKDICKGNSIQFHDITLGNPVSWHWQFPGGTPSTSTLKNPLVFYPDSGHYAVTLTVANSYCSSTTTFNNFIAIYPDPYVNLGNDTVVCAWSSLTLDAGNPGSRYLWSTGDTVQSIIVDTTGHGIGSRQISVLVTSPHQCTASDSIIVSFQICLGTVNLSEPFFTLYPNPSDGHMFVSTNGTGENILEIFNSDGVMIVSYDLTGDNPKINIDLSYLPQGLYIACLRNEQYTLIRRFIISKN
jgi:PKD repeat protein